MLQLRNVRTMGFAWNVSPHSSFHFMLLHSSVLTNRNRGNLLGEFAKCSSRQPASARGQQGRGSELQKLRI